MKRISVFVVLGLLWGCGSNDETPVPAPAPAPKSVASSSTASGPDLSLMASMAEMKDEFRANPGQAQNLISLADSVGPYVAKIGGLKPDVREKLFTKIAAGNLSDLSKLIGAEKAKKFVTMMRAADGMEATDYPTAARLNELFNASAGGLDLKGMYHAWSAPRVPGFSMGYLRDLTIPDDAHMKVHRGETVKIPKEWAVNLVPSGAKDLHLEICRQSPENALTGVSEPLPVPQKDKLLYDVVGIKLKVKKDAPIGRWKAYVWVKGKVDGQKAAIVPQPALMLPGWVSLAGPLNVTLDIVD